MCENVISLSSSKIKRMFHNPFEFGGTIYNGCALDPKTNERWCATSVDKNGKFQPLVYDGKGNYGICSESCPKYDHTGNQKNDKIICPRRT